MFGACRLAPHLGRRVGGQGAVVFAQHINSPSSLYAMKFFLLDDVFAVEKTAACNEVRSGRCFLPLQFFPPAVHIVQQLFLLRRRCSFHGSSKLLDTGVLCLGTPQVVPYPLPFACGIVPFVTANFRVFMSSSGRRTSAPPCPLWP